MRPIPTVFYAASSSLALPVAGHVMRRDTPATSWGPSSNCPPFQGGNFNITSYQLYPENMDWDAKWCQVYIGILFNASFGVYDPYAGKLEVHTFPGQTLVKDFHVGGVAWDHYSSLASAIIGQGNAFETSGVNISGDNFITKYNPATKKFLWKLNITAVTNGAYGGFNDITHDKKGNTYFCGTFPSSILKVDPEGKAIVPWYLPEKVDHTVRGYSGIASHGDVIITLDSRTGKLYRFNATAEKGVPVLLPHKPEEVISGGDAIRLPLKYGGKVLLVAEHVRGVSVLRSKDGSWTQTEYLGIVPNDSGLAAGALTVSVTQIGERIFTVTDWFGDGVVPGTVAGNKTVFPMIDITREVDALVGSR